MQLRAIAKSSRAIDGRIIERPGARPSPISPAILSRPVTFSSVAVFLLVEPNRGDRAIARIHPDNPDPWNAQPREIYRCTSIARSLSCSIVRYYIIGKNFCRATIIAFIPNDV